MQDWYDGGYYQRSPERNPGGPESGHRKVVRGGSWKQEPIYLRSALRLDDFPQARSYSVGFRCAKSAR